jgi:hypothetical protein
MTPASVEVLDQFSEQFTFSDHALELEFKDKRRLREFWEKIRELFPASERRKGFSWAGRRRGAFIP